MTPFDAGINDGATSNLLQLQSSYTPSRMNRARHFPRFQTIRSRRAKAGNSPSHVQRVTAIAPYSYPAKAKVAGMTSAQVNAEREEAIRSGDIVSSVDGDAGKKLNELYPNQYPSKAAVDLKTREQVNIEIAQSKHNNWLPNW